MRTIPLVLTKEVAKRIKKQGYNPTKVLNWFHTARECNSSRQDGIKFYWNNGLLYTVKLGNVENLLLTVTPKHQSKVKFKKKDKVKEADIEATRMIKAGFDGLNYVEKHTEEVTKTVFNDPLNKITQKLRNTDKAYNEGYHFHREMMAYRVYDLLKTLIPDIRPFEELVDDRKQKKTDIKKR